MEEGIKGINGNGKNTIKKFLTKDTSYIESLFGSSSRGIATTHTPLTKDRSSPLVGKVILFDPACSFGRDAHGLVREEGNTRLASQISGIDPGDQWGDRC